MTTTNRLRRPTWSEEDWRDRSACRTEPLERFFPSGYSLTSRADAAAAKAVCRVCPVREECLEFALATLQDHGIWGGYDEEERRVLRRRRRARAQEARPA